MKKVLWVVVIAVAALVIFVMMRPANGNDAKEFAKSAVLSTLRDAESARFRNLEYHHLRDRKTGGIEGDVCGEVNAKNGFGAYGGYKKFIVGVKVWDRGRSSLYTQPIINSDGVTAFDNLWNERCL